MTPTLRSDELAPLAAERDSAARHGSRRPSAGWRSRRLSPAGRCYFFGAGGGGSAEAWSAAYFHLPSFSTATAHQVPTSVVGAPPALGTVVSFQTPQPEETDPADRYWASVTAASVTLTSFSQPA